MLVLGETDVVGALATNVGLSLGNLGSESLPEIGPLDHLKY